MTDDTGFGGLLDAEQRHVQDPDSFSIPRSDVRRSLQPGDIVKLLFSIGGGDAPGAEKMWVEVVAADGFAYRGRLENEPTAISDLALGADVAFGPEHVAAIWRQSEHSPPGGSFAIVSDRIWHDGMRPTHAARAADAPEGFSGWVVSGPGDPRKPPADLEGFGPVPHEQLTDRHRAFDTIEDEPPGTRWRWDPDAVEWQPDPAEGADQG